MEIKIRSIKFDATEKLQAFVEKKVAKLEKSYEDIKSAEVQLKVVKPATAMNKEVSLSVAVTGTTLFVDRICADLIGTIKTYAGVDAFVDGAREDVATVVIRVFADEVDAAW